MALTKVTSGVRTLGTGEVATANMAVDPTNADNLSSGDVPLAQLGNVPASDTSGLEDDIALLGFKVASNGSLAKYNLVDQTVDAFEDASGVDASSSTNETRDASNYYSGITDTNPSGGTETSYVDSGTTYQVNTFTSDDDLVIPTGYNALDVLMVGGGGKGGEASAHSGGGGGGGAVLHRTAYSPGVATYAIVIGSGNNASPAAGGSTTGFSVTATGGGGGGTGGGAGNAGANGGGNGYSSSAGGAGTAPTASGWSVYAGYDGGSGFSGNEPHGGGGGAGATAAGTNGAGAFGAGTGGNGGAGKQITIANNSYYWAAGGGGTVMNNGTAGTGGTGGGGGGGSVYSAGAPNSGGGSALNSGAAGIDGDGTSTKCGGDAGANTGSGGGGTAGVGGDGIVIVTAEYSAPTASNLTLVSTTTAAQAAPTKGDIVLTYTNGAGSTTLGTDVTAEISADGGSTWTAMTLGSEGSTGSHNIATSHDVTITSTITSPYNMAYRIKTLNQAVGKTTRIQAVSLGWS